MEQLMTVAVVTDVEIRNSNSKSFLKIIHLFNFLRFVIDHIGAHLSYTCVFFAMGAGALTADLKTAKKSIEPVKINK